MTYEDLRDQLEGLIDATDLESVLNALEDICYLKAEHLQANWQDKVSAKFWDNAGWQIYKANANV